jgi:LysR family hydrogen peroxide-inducible transcriptional activator
VKFHVREDFPGALEDGLLDGQYDVLLIPLPIGSRQLAHVSLCREPLLLVLPLDHRLASKSRVNEGDLIGEQVLAIEERHPLHSQMQLLCSRFGASIRRDYAGTSLDTLRQMVVLGMGISFLPALYVHSEVRAGDGLKVLPIGGEVVSREHALVWRATSPSRALFREIGTRMRAIIRKSLAKVTLPAA